MPTFHCVPARSCRVCRWVVDGKSIDQVPELELEAGRELAVRIEAQRVFALVTGVDGRPPTFNAVGDVQLTPLPLGVREG
jgi:hypothetical protein